MDIIEQATLLNERKTKLVEALSTLTFTAQEDQLVDSIVYQAPKLEDLQATLNLMLGVMFLMTENSNGADNSSYKNHVPDSAITEEGIEEVTATTLLLNTLINAASNIVTANEANAVTIQVGNREGEGTTFASLRIMSRAEIEAARDSLQNKVFGKKNVRRMKKGH